MPGNPHPRFADVTACVFDAYGTLLDVHSAAERLRPALGDQADRLSAVWRTKQLEYTWLLSLMGRHRDFWQVTEDALAFAMAETGVTDNGLKGALMDQYRVLDAYPDAVSALDRVRAAGFKTAILSNGTPGMLQTAADNGGIAARLDAILSVESVGIYKPHPSVYRLATATFDCAPDAVCFVSSNGWDVAGAAAFGFRVAWINRFGRTAEHLPTGPDVILETLDDLPGLLGA